MGLTRPRAAQIFNIDYKQAVRAVTVTNVTTAGTAPNSVDGVNLSVNDRILVTGQNTQSDNGLYYVTTVGTGSNGTWVRTSDANDTGEVEAGMIVMVTEGTTYADTQWKLTTDNPIFIGVTGLTFVQNYSTNSISAGTSNVIVGTGANIRVDVAGTSNVAVFATTGEYVTGVVSATGNITGNYFIGNGSQLTGISAGTSYSNSNVATFLASFGSNTISTTGNITSGYILGNGSQLTGLSATYGNANVVANLAALGSNPISTTGNITGASLISATTLSATGNLIGGNLSVSGVTTLTGNATTGHILPTSNISYDLGSPTQMWRSIYVSGNTIYIGSSNLSISNGNLSVGNDPVVTVSPTGTSNTTGNMNVVGNITGSNVTTSGLVSATGNITGSYILGNGSQLTGLSATYGNANVVANLAALGSNPVSTTGNVTAGYFFGNASQLTGVLPSQTSNTGKYLKTDGSITSWSTLPTYLPVTLNSGNVANVSASNGYISVLTFSGSTANVTVQ